MLVRPGAGPWQLAGLMLGARPLSPEDGLEASLQPEFRGSGRGCCAAGCFPGKGVPPPGAQRVNWARPGLRAQDPVLEEVPHGHARRGGGSIHAPRGQTAPHLVLTSPCDALSTAVSCPLSGSRSSARVPYPHAMASSGQQARLAC